MTASSLMNTYARLPLAFTRGSGCWLHDETGQRFFDTTSGIAVCGLGHSHPAVTRAICSQAGQLIHCSNHYHIPQQRMLAERLCQIAAMDAVFFCNSGAEANETAIKLARLHGRSRRIESPAVIVMENAYHGRTLATLSASRARRMQAGFEPLVAGFVRAPMNDLASVHNISRSNRNVVAVMLELIQGDGGVILADPAYVQGLRALCDQQGWLLIVDEILTGNGRTGSYFAYQDYGVMPDIVTTAKGLGNGVPIGACLAVEPAASLFRPGSHGSSSGGNPLACSAALAVVDTIAGESLCERALQLGERLLKRLRHDLSGADYIRDIRGRGLMIGIELAEACNEMEHLACTQGLLINVTADRVVRLLPPLNMTDGEADELAGNLVRLLRLYAGDDRRKPRN